MTNYRGAGVKFELAALSFFKELGCQWPRIDRPSRTKHKRLFNMEKETEQVREYSRETLKIETRKKGKEFVAKTNEVEYIIECPPPQDRPPD